MLALFGLLAPACAQEPLGEARLIFNADDVASTEIVTFSHASELERASGPTMQFYTEAEYTLGQGSAAQSGEFQLQILLPYGEDPTPELIYHEPQAGELLRFSTRAAQVLWLDNLDTPCDCQGLRVTAEFFHPGPDGKEGTADDQVRRIEDGALTAIGSHCIPAEPLVLTPGEQHLSHVRSCHSERRRPAVDREPVTADELPVTVILLSDCSLLNPWCYEHGVYPYDDAEASGCDSGSASTSSGCEGGQSSSGCEDDESETAGCSDNSRGGGCEDDGLSAQRGRHPLSGPLQNYLLIGLALCLVRPRRRP